MKLYMYRGDRLTRSDLRGGVCRALLRSDGKCILSRHTGTMAVEFSSGERSNVLRRQLRRIGEKNGNRN